jgi:hypothetical protein
VEIHSGEHKRNAKKFAGVTRSSILNARFLRVRKKGHVQGPTFKFAHGMKSATKFNFVLVNKGKKETTHAFIQMSSLVRVEPEIKRR